MNGKKIKSRKIISYPKSNTGINQTIVGSHRQGNTNSIYFHGKIDDVKIYNRELTSEEIKDAYDINQSLDLGPNICLEPGEKKILSAKGFNTYKWSNGASVPSIEINTSGTYSVTTTDQFGKQYYDEIIVWACPQLNLGEDKCIEVGETLELKADGFQNYLWSTGAQTPSIIVSLPGTYQLSATDAFGKVKTEAIIISSCPTLDLGPDICLSDGQRVELKPSGFNNYQWSTGSTESFLIISSPGIYSLTAKDIFGRQITDEISVSICPQLRIPNIITPNGDNLNDFFKIEEMSEAINYKLKIYNRWGKLVHSSNNYRNGWKGDGLSSGVYFYHLKEDVYGQTYKGWIEIIL